MNILLLFFWTVLFFISFYKRKDLFSPLKIFLFNIFLFWGDIFYDGNYNFWVNFYFVLILAFGFVIWFNEGAEISRIYKVKIFLYRKERKKIFQKLWLLTLVPVLSQIFLIIKMGGLERYVWSMNLRVKEWAGLGVIIILIRSILIINFLYFVFLIKLKNVKFKEYIYFMLNFIIFILIALLSSSRSTLLVNIVLMFVSYYTFVKKISTYKILASGLLMLFIVVFLGAARNGYKLEDGKFTTAITESKSFEAANFRYGLFPLQIITETKDLKGLSLGVTYLTVITNLIPRFFWENKPDPGGVVFTKKYHNIHNGYSNYSTGLITESIMNFGFYLGPIFSLVLISFIYSLFFKYVNKNRKLTMKKLVVFISVYVNVLFLLPTYFHGEFTTVTHTIFVGKVFFIIIFSNIVFPKKQYLLV